MGKRASNFSCLLLGILCITGCAAFYIYSYLRTDSDSNLYCETVHRVAAYEGIAYLLTTDIESNYRRYETKNMGQTWHQTEDTPEQVSNALRYPNPTLMPTEICDPTQLQNCYRISTISREIEHSTNKGESWETITIPSRFVSCGQPRPTSLVFVTYPDRKSILIIGMGTGGVAVYSADRNWTYHDIDSLHNLP